MLATLIAVPLAVAAGLATFLLGQPDAERAGPVAVDPPPAPSAGPGAVDVRAACARLLDTLPERIDGRRPREITRAPADQAAAWGDPPVVLRCGVEPPPVAPDAQLITVDGVTWVAAERGRTVRWTSTDRAVPVEIQIPVDEQAHPVLAAVAPATRTVPAASPSR